MALVTFDEFVRYDDIVAVLGASPEGYPLVKLVNGDIRFLDEKEMGLEVWA